MDTEFLKKEDYEEPCCVLKKPESVSPIPVGRILDKLDDYLAQQDFAAAERHLKYWIEEARAGNDGRGELLMLNEQIGLYRKLEKEAESLAAAERAPEYAVRIGMDGTVTMGTTLVNAATAFKAFGQAERALALYEQAKLLYEELLQPDDSRLGGLYNNMALAVMEIGDFDRAEALFGQALAVMERLPGKEAEQAITWCNLADLAEAGAAANGCEADDQIAEYLEKAKELLDSPNLKRDAYYAFICDKCASDFGYHGFFIYEEELKSRAEEIYERI